MEYNDRPPMEGSEKMQNEQYNELDCNSDLSK